MGKSMVLKDLQSRPAGYLRQEKETAFCRAGLEKPARLVVVFTDETDCVFELREGRNEQRFSCEEHEMCGGYVFCGNELLMLSDERMRRLFENRMRKGREKPLQQAKEKTEPTKKSKPPEPAERPAFAQRRWPPPPCWNTAQYREGKWQEG